MKMRLTVSHMSYAMAGYSHIISYAPDTNYATMQFVLAVSLTQCGFLEIWETLRLTRQPLR
jgi:hypothetical protein